MDSLGVLYEEVRDGSTFPLVRCGSVPLAFKHDRSRYSMYFLSWRNWNPIEVFCCFITMGAYYCCRFYRGSNTANWKIAPLDRGALAIVVGR